MLQVREVHSVVHHAKAVKLRIPDGESNSIAAGTVYAVWNLKTAL